MQKRFCDRGHVYDYMAWRQIFGGLSSPGVYKGFGLSVDGAFLKIGVEHSDTEPGMLMLSSGIGVTEDSSISLEAPSVAGTYTILAEHTDNELIGGTATTYRISTSYLTSNPTNGVIIGWINHDGTSFADWMLTPAYKLNPLDVSKVYSTQAPIVWSPPDLLVESLGDCVAAQGWDSADYLLWKGVQLPGTYTGTRTVAGRLQWQVSARPFALRIRSIIPTGCQIQANLYDTNHAPILASPEVFSPHSTWTWNSLVNDGSAPGTWTVGDNGIIVLNLVVNQNNTIKISDIILDSWPYGIARV